MSRFVLAALLAALLAGPAAAACALHDAQLRLFEAEHGERPAGYGLRSDGRVLELLVNPETGSWTILILRSDGLSCAVSAGEGWRPARPEPIPEGDPT